MKHRILTKTFGCTSNHRRSMFRNMVVSLIKNDSVVTTLAKAKELRRLAEPLITLSKIDDLHKRRQALSYLGNKDAVNKLFNVLGPHFKNRQGGYTSILKAGFRIGDAAAKAILVIKLK